MGNIDWKYWGDWALEAWKIYKGKAPAKVCLAGFILATLFLANDHPYLSAITALASLLSTTLWAFWDAQPAKEAENLSYSQIIALRHQSFEGNTRRLSAQDLSKALKNSKIHHKDIDQSQFYKNGILQGPEVALQVQSTSAMEMKTLLCASPQARFAYYGKAHIPLVLTLGYQMQGSSVLLFELDRLDGHWHGVENEKKGVMDVIVERSGIVQPEGDAVIRVSISYAVNEAEILPVVPAPHADIYIKIGQSKIDAIENREQVDAIADAFRTALDELKNSALPPARIHVFCAAPMSVVFAMGRRISPTIHPPVLVYNYTATTSPRYAWGVQLNSLPEPCIIYPIKLEQETSVVRSA